MKEEKHFHTTKEEVEEEKKLLCKMGKHQLRKVKTFMISVCCNNQEERNRKMRKEQVEQVSNEV